jgi:hypothetical protein
VFNAVSQHIIDFMETRIDFDLKYVSLQRIQNAAYCVKQKILPKTDSINLEGCWGFIDGTVRPIARPEIGQEGTYNGHHRVHALKYQSVVMADGMIVSLSGPYPGNRHDVYMLNESRLIENLSNINYEDNDRFFIYGDAGYTSKRHLLTGYQGIDLSTTQKHFNRVMSSIREPVEWCFKDIIQKWGFLRDKWNLKSGLQPVGNYYRVAAILTNCHNCFYPNQTSQYFGCKPGTIYEYLG